MLSSLFLLSTKCYIRLCLQKQNKTIATSVDLFYGKPFKKTASPHWHSRHLKWAYDLINIHLNKLWSIDEKLV